MATWYVFHNNVQTGPVSEEQLKNMGLNPKSLVWREGMAEWQTAGSVPELASLFNGESGFVPPSSGEIPPRPNFDTSQQTAFGARQQGMPYNTYCPQDMYVSQSGKDKTAAGILAILLGGLGVQYFYIGKIGAGFITILLSFVTCGLWNVITLVQGILMLTMTQEQFDQKYVYSDSTLPLF